MEIVGVLPPVATTGLRPPDHRSDLHPGRLPRLTEVNAKLSDFGNLGTEISSADDIYVDFGNFGNVPSHHCKNIEKHMIIIQII
nr:hypothetical protein Itr_chr14CG18950 [Ipomoea trifida]